MMFQNRICVAVLVSCIPTIAQIRPTRTLAKQQIVGAAKYNPHEVGEPSSLEFLVDPGGKLTTQGPDSDGFSAAELAELQALPLFESLNANTRTPIMRSVQTGITVPGDYCVWSNALDIVICGSQ